MTIRPEGSDGCGLMKVLHLDVQDEDEDDGFWGDLGDFFGGVIDELGDFFEDLLGWLKEAARELWEEIRRGDAEVYRPDENRPLGPKNWGVNKQWRF
ncbi:MAG: hypothetical protein HYZ89_05320 [Candidatus Omnitrophica bacterium]|nr:hypothetical protein [Candidatus Omnitrophota bacterium]